MLERLYVDNYRSLVNFECRPKSRQLILGPNGAGKTTLFDVLELLRDFCIRGRFPGEDGAASPEKDPVMFVGRSRTRWQDVAEQTFELNVSGNGGRYAFRLVVDSWGNPERPRVVEESLDFQGTPIFRFLKGEVSLYNDKLDGKAHVQYPFDWHRSALATIAERKDNKALWWFKQWLDGLLCISPDPRAMIGVAAHEAKTPDRHLARFADWYRHLRQETEDHEYIQDLSDIIEHFVTMRLEDAGERRREIKVRMAAPSHLRNDKPSEFLLSELSDGQRTLIGLYAVLHFALRPGATLCFDEPDNYIALRELQPWLNKLLDRVEDEESRSQVLIVSHHPELLNRMAFQDGLILDRPGGRHTRVRPFTDSSQTGLSPAELVARGWDNE